MGFGIVATEGTANAIRGWGVPVEVVKKIAEGRPNVVDIIHNKEVQLVINTPAGSHARSDGYQIRNAALRSGLSIVTTLAAAAAAAEAIESMQKTDWKIRSLQSYYADLNIKVETKTFGKVKKAEKTKA